MARLPSILLGCWRHAAHILVIFFIAAGLNVWSSAKALSISVDSWLSQQNALEPCGAISSVRLFQTAVPVTPTEMPTIDPNAPTPTTRPPSATPRPAPTEDRVGFPEGYYENFKLLFILDRPDNRQIRVICGNELAASVKPGEPFPYGSVLVMETYRGRRDAKGNAVLDEKGHFIRESLNAINVMRKERGFGLDYQDERSGEWEYVAYREDGKFQTSPQNTSACASCHLKQAGESKDFVFRTDFFFDREKAMVPPPVGENEVNIFLYAFMPQTVTVKAGTTVKWINNDEAEHSIEARDKSFVSEMLKTKNVTSGESFSYTFTKAGTYNYICGNHSGMTARVEVTE